MVFKILSCMLLKSSRSVDNPTSQPMSPSLPSLLLLTFHTAFVFKKKNISSADTTTYKIIMHRRYKHDSEVSSRKKKTSSSHTHTPYEREKKKKSMYVEFFI